jgi:hypothetical protein
MNRPRTCAPPPFTPAELAENMEVRLDRFRDQMLATALADYGYAHVAAATAGGPLADAVAEISGVIDLAARAAA